MGRRDLSDVKAKVLAHNRLLKEYELSLRTRRNWISRYNGISVSLDTLSRWEEEEENRTVEPEKSDTRLEWLCDECHGKLQFDKEAGELHCLSCGLVHEKVESHSKVDLLTQLEQYQPSLSSSFNHGLGTPTPESLLRFAVTQLTKTPTPRITKTKRTTQRNRKPAKHRERKQKTAAYKQYGDVLRLKVLMSNTNRDRDSRVNTLLEHLTRRMRQIHGFDPTSDKDAQFAELDQLGKFIRQVRVALKGHTFNSKKCVDALLFIIYGEKARVLIERPEKRLQCPRCRRERPYAHDTNPSFLLCVKCGKQVLAAEAKFKVSFTPVDPVYVNTILRLMPALPTQLVQSYTTPLVIGQVPVEAI